MNSAIGKVTTAVHEIDKASALANLDRIIRAAVSPAMAARHRQDLGEAASWLQSLIDCGLLPDAAMPPSREAAMLSSPPDGGATQGTSSAAALGRGGLRHHR